MRTLFDKPVEPVWTPEAPRRGDERSEESIPLSPPEIEEAPLRGFFDFCWREGLG